MITKKSTTKKASSREATTRKVETREVVTNEVMNESYLCVIGLADVCGTYLCVRDAIYVFSNFVIDKICYQIYNWSTY